MRFLQLIGIFLCSWSTLYASSAGSDFPVVKVDSLGNAVSMWQMTVGNARQIHSSSFSSTSQTWSAPICLSAEGVDASVPVLKLNSTGVAVAFWLEAVSETRVLKTARFDFTNGWSAPHALSTPHQFVNDNYSVQLTRSGVAFAVWHAYLPLTKEFGVFASSATNASNWTTPANISSAAPEYLNQRARPVKPSPILKKQ